MNKLKLNFKISKFFLLGDNITLITNEYEETNINEIYKTKYKYITNGNRTSLILGSIKNNNVELNVTDDFNIIYIMCLEKIKLYI